MSEENQNNQPAKEPSAEPEPTSQERRASRYDDGSQSPRARSQNEVGYLRPTSASQCRVPSLASLEVSTPSEVQKIATMTPRDRVKAEYAAQRAKKRGMAPSAGFTGGTPRQGLLARNGVDPTFPTNVTPQAQRKAEMERERQVKREQDAKYEVPKPKVWSAKTYVDPAAKEKKKGAGLWARNREERFMYNFTWGGNGKQFPASIPQKSQLMKAPGPGSYGKSTSFLS